MAGEVCLGRLDLFGALLDLAGGDLSQRYNDLAVIRIN